mgnify:CR=1 FL=1
MIELVKTTDPVRLTYLQALLDDAGISFFVFDQHISMLEAGIGAFPRRIMIEESYQLVAKITLQDANQFYND